MVQEINTQGLGVSELPYELFNLDIVKQFYENSKPSEEAPLVKVS